MNKIYVDIDFTNGTLEKKGIDLITGDYASTEIEFTFDENHNTGRKTFEMKSPSNEVVLAKDIENNKILLAAKDENENNVSLFGESGYYIFEVSYRENENKLTSVYGKIPVRQEQVIIGDEIVEPYLPIFDQLFQEVDSKISEMDSKIEEADTKIETIDDKIEEVNTAIEETNNLNIDVSDKVNKEVTITLTKKDNTTKSVKISDGLSLQFMWQGTSLGIKTDDMQDYVFVDLQGIQGVPGPQGEPFRIKKTYPSVQAMNDDFNNMNYGDYVMIASSVEVQDNAKLYTRGESQWIFITDFSGATGIKGETGATPSISIGSVTSGATPSVTRTGTDENPVLNFVLQKGDKGDTGNTGATGATGNGISSIEKTAETPSQKDYRINYTNGEHFDYSVENGEVTQAQLDEVIAENDYLNSIIDQIVPKTSATGTSITLDDTLQARMNMSLSPSELSQDGEPTPETPYEVHTISGDNTISIVGRNYFNYDFAKEYSNTTFNAYRFIEIKYTRPNTRYSIYNYTTIDSSKFANVFLANDNSYSGISFRNLTQYDYGDITTNASGKLYLCTYQTTWTEALWEEFIEYFKNAMVVEGTDKTYSYEPHQDQTAQVNLGDLEYSKIGNYADVFMKPSGKNLFDESNMYSGYYNTTSPFDLVSNNAYRTMIINNLPAGTYTFNTTLNNCFLLRYWTNNTNYTIGREGSSYTITTTATSKFMLCFRNTSSSTITETFTTMLNKGSTALPYEPYNNNKWYLKKNIGKVVLDGSESWTKNTAVVSTNAYINNDLFPNRISQTIIYSNYFSRINSASGTGIYNGLGLNICIEGSDYDTTTKFNTWLSNHNTDIYYPLSTPTYTLLNDTLQSQLDTIESMLLSYKEQTNISQINNDLPFIMTSTALKEL